MRGCQIWWVPSIQHQICNARVPDLISIHVNTIPLGLGWAFSRAFLCGLSVTFIVFSSSHFFGKTWNFFRFKLHRQFVECNLSSERQKMFYFSEIVQNWFHSRNGCKRAQNDHGYQLCWAAVSYSCGYSWMNIQNKGSLEGILPKTRPKNSIQFNM